MTTAVSLSTAWPFLLLTTILVAVFCASLYRASNDGGVQRIHTLLFVITVPLAIGLLYAVKGEPRALSAAMTQPHQAQQSIASAVQNLADRLRKDPSDIDGWLMLARSYSEMGRFEEADAAYEHARTKIWNDPALLADWAEIHLMATDQQFDARAHELVERAGALAPDNPDIMFMQALAAMDKGDRPAAIALMRGILKYYPTGTPDRQALDEVIERVEKEQAASKGRASGAP